MTHDYLVEKAANFLKYKKNCSVVLKELACGVTCGEIPDAIGWKNMRSYLIECKTSRSDFLADKNKRFRKFSQGGEHFGHYGMGIYRYYFCPKGVITPDDLPDNWGLVILDGRSYKEIITCDKSLYKNKHVLNEDDPVRYNEPTIQSLQNEITMLTSMLSRLDTDSKYLKN